MSGTPSCQTYSSSTVISYSSTDSGAPKVYQQTSEVRTAPGGVRINIDADAAFAGKHQNHIQTGTFSLKY